MRYLYTLVIVCLAAAVAQAQTAASYVFSQDMGTFSSISSSGTTIFSGSWDDNVSNSRSIGFNFTYCGKMVNRYFPGIRDSLQVLLSHPLLYCNTRTLENQGARVCFPPS